MKKLLFNSSEQLRNPWWVLIFIACVALTRFIYSPISQGLKTLDAPEISRDIVSVLLILFATWICTKLRKEKLSSIGLKLDPKWAKEIGAGWGIGVLAIMLLAGCLWLFADVSFQLDPNALLPSILYALSMFAFAAALEEILFRGFLFQRFIDGAGIWIAQICMAFLFSIAHWTSPGMEGSTKILASLNLGLLALVFGLAYIKTKSLALPIGLHVGWNWAQGSVFGFEVSGIDHTGFLSPTFGDSSIWLTGGEFGPEASVFCIVVNILLLLGLWKWAGTAATRDDKDAAHRIDIGSTSVATGS